MQEALIYVDLQNFNLCLDGMLGSALHTHSFYIISWAEATCDFGLDYYYRLYMHAGSFSGLPKEGDVYCGWPNGVLLYHSVSEPSNFELNDHCYSKLGQTKIAWV